MFLCTPPARPDVQPLDDAETRAAIRRALGRASWVPAILHVPAVLYALYLLQSSYRVLPRVGDGLWLDAWGVFQLSLILLGFGVVLGIAGAFRKSRGSAVGLCLNALLLLSFPLTWAVISPRWF